MHLTTKGGPWIPNMENRGTTHHKNVENRGTRERETKEPDTRSPKAECKNPLGNPPTAPDTDHRHNPTRWSRGGGGRIDERKEETHRK